MDCDDFKLDVTKWFLDELECRGDANGFTITLPLLKPNGDSIELGISVIGESSWRISDLGQTQETLYIAGIDLSEESERTDEFQRLVNDHGLREEDGELSLPVSEDLPSRVFDFASAVQSLLALQFTIKTRQPRRDFASIVAKFLAEQQAQFEVPTDLVDGKTGRWRFNFTLNTVAPPTFVKTLTATSRGEAMSTSEKSVFEIRDVLELHTKLRTAVIIDDEGERESLWKPSVRRVFDGYEIPLIGFVSQRDRLTSLAQEYRRA
jgi:hypothetical protein